MYDIILSDGEKLVKRYKCTELKFPRYIGHLYVTNKRVIFSGNARGSMVMNDVQLSTITGVKAFSGGRLSITMFLLGVISAIFAIYNIIMLFSRYGFGLNKMINMIMFIVLIIAAAVSFWMCYRKTFKLQIYSSGATGTPISIGEGLGSLGGNSALFALTAAPSRDTEEMILELSALIGDFQAMGDLAIERWKRRERYEDEA